MPKAEVITAFTGVLELTRKDKVITTQEKLFGDIIVSKKPEEKKKKNKNTKE